MSFSIDKIKATAFVALTSFVLTSITSGFLFIYIFSKDLFYNLDLVRLILLAIGITVPVTFFNSLIIAAKSNLEPRQDDSFAPSIFLFMAVIFTSPLFYSVIVAGYFFGLELKMGVILILSLEFILALILIFSKPWKEG